VFSLTHTHTHTYTHTHTHTHKNILVIRTNLIYTRCVVRVCVVPVWCVFCVSNSSSHAPPPEPKIDSIVHKSKCGLNPLQNSKPKKARYHTHSTPQQLFVVILCLGVCVFALYSHRQSSVGHIHIQYYLSHILSAFCGEAIRS
jgi:hypothetical protein